MLEPIGFLRCEHDLESKNLTISFIEDTIEHQFSSYYFSDQKGINLSINIDEFINELTGRLFSKKFGYFHIRNNIFIAYKTLEKLDELVKIIRDVGQMFVDPQLASFRDKEIVDTFNCAEWQKNINTLHLKKNRYINETLPSSYDNKVFVSKVRILADCVDKIEGLNKELREPSGKLQTNVSIHSAKITDFCSTIEEANKAGAWLEQEYSKVNSTRTKRKDDIKISDLVNQAMVDNSFYPKNN